MSNTEKGQLETAERELETDVSKDKIETQTDEQKSDSIKYSTHKKLLNQLKNKSEELEELRKFKSEYEEKEAKKKGDYETLLKSKQERIQSLEEKLNSYERDLTEGTKLQAFIDKLPGKVKRSDYLSFVNLEDIALDPETKAVDSYSLEKAVDNFVKEYGDLLDMKTKNTLPKVTSYGGRPNKKRSLKELSRDELRAAYLAGDFEE